MNKKFKVFLIIISIILVVASIAGTVFFFYKRHQIKTRTVDIKQVYSQSVLDDFYDNFVDLKTKVETSDSADTRFGLLDTMRIKLDSSVQVIGSYFESENYLVVDESLAKAKDKVIASRNLALNMMKEYNVKYQNTYFPKNIGANDPYIGIVDYYEEYANFIQILSGLIGNGKADKSVDAKFAMIDFYMNMIKYSCELIFNPFPSNYKVLLYANNFTTLNEKFVLENRNLTGFATNKEFSIEYSMFVDSYYKSDKKVLCSHFVELLNKNNTITNSSTNEEKTVYYFKDIYGI